MRTMQKKSFVDPSSDIFRSDFDYLPVVMFDRSFPDRIKVVRLGDIPSLNKASGITNLLSDRSKTFRFTKSSNALG